MTLPVDFNYSKNNLNTVDHSGHGQPEPDKIVARIRRVLDAIAVA